MADDKAEKPKINTAHVDHETCVNGARMAKKLKAAGLWPPVMKMGIEVIPGTPEEQAKALAAPLVEGEVKKVEADPVATEKSADKK